MDFKTNFLPLLLLHDGIFIFALLEYEFLLEFFATLVLLFQTLVLPLDLQIDLLLFGQATNLQISAFATRL